MDERVAAVARSVRGFMPEDEGRALYEAGLTAAGHGRLLEIGSYCGKSAVYLGAAAAERGTFLYSIDHHRGSEEHQPGEAYHDDTVYDPDRERVDTLPELLRNIVAAGLEGTVVPIVGTSSSIARHWAGSLALVFIDGGHSSETAERDLEGWGPKVAAGGFLAIHDVFEDPADGGRPPFQIYSTALATGAFEEASRCGTLRVLQRVGDDI